MRAVALIAANFVREQRWVLVFLLLWVVGFQLFGFFVSSESGAEDALMLYKQLAFYGVVFAVFFGSSALSSDLRSRRILAVLSKAVSRGQYLTGLLAGMGYVLGTFCACTGFAANAVLGRYGLGQGELWLGVLAFFTACVLTAALALCLSVFLPPLFAAIACGIVVGLPALLALRGMGAAGYVVPVYALLEPLLDADFNVARRVGAAVILVGFVETALLILAAAWIFKRRDLAAGIE